MPKNPYTQKHVNQFRGPADSDAFNNNAEDVYRDLVYLHNKSNELDSDVTEGLSALVKDLRGMSLEIEDLKTELAAVKATNNTKYVFYTGSEIEDTGNFNGSAYEVELDNRLWVDDRYTRISLSSVVNSSVSRLHYANTTSEVVLPPSLEMLVVANDSSVDDGTSVRTSSPYDAVLMEPGKIWERNVKSGNGAGEAIVDLMVRLPAELTVTPYVNMVNLLPFPLYSTDILGIYYSEDPAGNLSVNDPNWVPINKDADYRNNDNAVGKIAPGAWDGDEVLQGGPLSFIFPPRRASAIKITLRQRGSFQYDGTNLYSYGLSLLDVRYEKFRQTGTSMFRIEPKAGDTITAIESVQPYIYNVPAAALADVFEYRVIWETAPDSGVYTLTPVPSSEKVWLEVTLKKDSEENLPAMSGFRVQYS